MKDVLKELEDIAEKLDTINTQMNDEERVWAEELADRKRQGLTGDAAVKHYNEWTLIGKKYTYDFDAKVCNINGDYWDNNFIGVSRECSISQFKKYIATELEELSETDFQKIMDELVEYFF